MYSISDKQIDFILNDIRARGVEMEDLQYNLLDHVCCLIEQNLEVNGDFESFYQRTIKQFYKHELWEIEEETISLQIFKHYYTMKKIMIGSGIVSALLMIAGIFFKFMHWPGASFFLVLGIGSSSLIFLPMFFTLKIKEKQKGKDKLIIGLGSICATLISLSILFKVMHWPGANMMALICMGIMVFLFIPIFFFSGIRNPETRVNTIVSTVLLVIGCGLFLTLVNSRPSIKIQNSIAYSNQEVSDAYDYLTEQNNKVYDAITSDTSTNSKDLQLLREKCADLCEKIEGFKVKLASGVNGVETKKIDYYDLNLQDNFDIPTKMLFDDEKNRKPSLSLTKLKSELAELNKLASTTFKINSSKLINLGDSRAVQEEEGTEPWETSAFYHTPTSLVLKNFSQLQLDIRIIESNCFCSNGSQKYAALTK
ncbi:MAG TPA: hypothetical protein VGF30_07125 [Bacteroidia bacterium]